MGYDIMTERYSDSVIGQLHCSPIVQIISGNIQEE